MREQARVTVGRAASRLLVALVCGMLFLLPLFGWLAAEPTPYQDPAGQFTFTPPESWATDDSGHMGPGLVVKGPAGASGAEPLIHLTHEPAGIVTLDVRWQTLLGQLRFDNERMRFITIEEHPEATPPYGQSIYFYRRGSQSYQAITRLVLARGRFYQITATVPEDDFDLFYQTFLTAFDSLRVAAVN